jgi:3-hydroxyisobutyrate dehydrogenase-like beta-hydroxyacid dehydrogenase
MTDLRTVGVLGTGIMGAPMTRTLVKAGHAVRARNRGVPRDSDQAAT